MTMPVEIETSAQGSGSMSFVLPRENSQKPPTPKAADVTLEEVPARLVAVKAFAGIVTDEEVRIGPPIIEPSTHCSWRLPLPSAPGVCPYPLLLASLTTDPISYAASGQPRAL